MMRDFFPGRSESSIKCRWHVYLKQGVKGDPPEYKRNILEGGQVLRQRKRKKRKGISSTGRRAKHSSLDGEDTEEDVEEDDDEYVNEDEIDASAILKLPLVRPGRRTIFPNIKSRSMILNEARRKKRQELNIIIPAISLTGSCCKESRVRTKSMLKRVRAKTDLELDPEEKDFFREYCYSPRHGTPIADRIVATNCLASLFFTKDIPVPQELQLTTNSLLQEDASNEKMTTNTTNLLEFVEKQKPNTGLSITGPSL